MGTFQVLDNQQVKVLMHVHVHVSTKLLGNSDTNFLKNEVTVHVHVRTCICMYSCVCTVYMYMYTIRLDVHCICWPACLALPYLAYTTVDLNPANWAASVAQLAEHWTSNPVVTGLNPIRGSSVFFHCLPSDFALLDFPCFNLHIHVRD